MPLSHNGKAAGSATNQDAEGGMLVAHSLRAAGFDASEDGTGRGTPIIPILEPGKRQGTRDSNRDGLGIGEPGDPMFTLQAGAQHGVAYGIASDALDRSGEATNGTAEDRAGLGVTEELSPVLKAKRPNAVAYNIQGANSNAKESHAVETDTARCLDQASPTNNQGGTVVSVCLGSDPITASDIAQPQTTRNGDPGVVFLPFDTTQITSAQNRNHPKPGDPCHPLARAAHAPAIAYAVQATHRGVGQGHNTTHVSQRYGVRRLTPKECERLQGFPDGHTATSYRGKPAADGPRYRGLGNSMATTIMQHIGQQIERAHNWTT